MSDLEFDSSGPCNPGYNRSDR